MSEFKEFTSKVLDDAIRVACDHFGVTREKLELEIVTGGSSGIFGLMSKKAVVKARLREKREPFADLQGEQSLFDDLKPERVQAPATKPAPKPAPKPARKPAAKPNRRLEPAASNAQAASKSESGAKPKATTRPEPKVETAPEPKQEGAPAPKPESSPEPRREQPKPQQAEAASASGFEGKGAAVREDTRDPEPDEATLNDFVLEVVQRLLDPIIGQTKLVISNEPGRIKVLVDDEENSGLIIGREGQTITALQYITNRIVARRFQTNARVHLDAGDYRDKQDESLRNLAHYLAEKAKDQGRTQSTKPLSSYHRRLVHLALQDDATVSTRSKGEGPLKRVLIYPSNNGNRRSGRKRSRA